MIYASISFNCFIMYVIMRRGFTAMQDCLMSGASPSPRCPITLQPKQQHHHRQQRQNLPFPTTSIPHVTIRSWRQWMGDMTVVLAYNRAPFSSLPGILPNLRLFEANLISRLITTLNPTQPLLDRNPKPNPTLLYPTLH